MANPHQGYAMNPQPGPSQQQQQQFFQQQAMQQGMTPAMLAHLQQQQQQQHRLAAQMKLQQQQQAMQHQQQQQQQQQHMVQQMPPGFNPAINPQVMLQQERQMAQAKAVAQQQLAEQQARQQQQQFGFDPRMMPPPPPPAGQRPPSTRPGTAGGLPPNVAPGMQRQQGFQSPQPFPQQAQIFPSGPPFDPPQTPQAQQGGGFPQGMSPAQMQQLQQLRAQGQPSPIPQPPQADSPSLRKRKLPPSAPSPAPSTSSARPPVVPQGPGTHLNPAFTRITKVPLAGSGTTIPPLSEEDMKNMKLWMERDTQYERDWKAMRDRGSKELTMALRSKVGWWDEPVRGPKQRIHVLSSKEKRDRTEKRRRAGVLKWEGIKLPGRLHKEDAEKREDLVPIRLELDVEHHKLRDTFVWNVNDPIVTPEMFAQSIVADYKLSQHYRDVIAKSIHEQLQEHEAAKEDEKAAEAREHGHLDENSGTWWSAWRKRIRTEAGYVRVGTEEEDGDADDEGQGTRRRKRKKRNMGVVVRQVMGEVPMELEELRPKETPTYDEELRIMIKLDILVGSMKLDDQFEWDVSCPTNSPEQFAECYAAELGLPGEFMTAIAHQIREQVYAYRKTMATGQIIDDEDMRPILLPPVTRSTIARTLDAAHQHMPVLNYMSDGEIERSERERDKELKRKRRTARGRTQAARIIPDRTYRTPGIGFPESDNAALQAAGGNAPLTTTSRRAAAAAASVTIANMVASENSTSPTQGHLPNPILPREPPKKPPPPPPPPKAAPQKLFKPPPVPPAAVRARAKVLAPTPSTSLDPKKYKRVPQTEADEPPEDDIPPPMPVRLTAKQMRDLEKEAKEKEYADGQHANMINGVWHCSNCGCPESIAVGRRKGPLGDKSQCGPCGKYYHRHRRPRPVEYHADEEWHLNQRVEADRAKKAGRKGGGGAARAVPDSNASVKNTPAKEEKEDEEDEEEEHPLSKKPESKPEPTAVTRGKSVSRPPDSVAAAASPADSSSSEEGPLAMNNKAPKVNGSGAQKTEPLTPTPAPASIPPPTPVQAPAVPASASEAAAPAAKPVSQASPAQASPQISHASVSPTATRPVSKSTIKTQVPRPEWLKNALDEMQRRYPDDRFDVVLRKITDPNAPVEWRIKCLDCPGKLYTPGPAETLVNFDVHLRNRNHRARVHARLQGLQSVSPPQ